MSITDEQIIEFEKENEDAIFGALREFISAQRKQIEHIQEFSKYIGIDENIPNIGITCNNKLIEISQQFREKDLSMFVDVIEEENFIGSNLVGDSIINDIITKLSAGGKAITEYDYGIQNIIKNISEKNQALTKVNPIKKLFYKIRDILGINEPLYSKQDIEKIKTKLYEYTDIDKQVYSYNLEENLTESIIKYLKKDVYSEDIKPMIVEEMIIPVVEDLDLKELVPEIEKRFKEEVLKKEDSKSKKSWELSETQKQEIEEKSEQIVKDSNKENIKQDDSDGERI